MSSGEPPEDASRDVAPIARIIATDLLYGKPVDKATTAGEAAERSVRVAAAICEIIREREALAYRRGRLDATEAANDRLAETIDRITNGDT